MKVGQGLCKVLPKAIFVAIEGFNREQGYVLHINRCFRIIVPQKQTESGFGNGFGACEHQLIFSPF